MAVYKLKPKSSRTFWKINTPVAGNIGSEVKLLSISEKENVFSRMDFIEFGIVYNLAISSCSILEAAEQNETCSIFSLGLLHQKAIFIFKMLLKTSTQRADAFCILEAGKSILGLSKDFCVEE